MPPKIIPEASQQPAYAQTHQGELSASSGPTGQHIPALSSPSAHPREGGEVFLLAAGFALLAAGESFRKAAFAGDLAGCWRWACWLNMNVSGWLLAHTLLALMYVAKVTSRHLAGWGFLKMENAVVSSSFQFR